MFKKARCYICGQKDFKSNMENVSFGIYGKGMESRYAHLSCVKSVICEPEAHGHNTVDRALWVEECLAQRTAREKSDEEYRNSRVKEAQARICS